MLSIVDISFSGKRSSLIALKFKRKEKENLWGSGRSRYIIGSMTFKSVKFQSDPCHVHSPTLWVFSFVTSSIGQHGPQFAWGGSIGVVWLQILS